MRLCRLFTFVLGCVSLANANGQNLFSNAQMGHLKEIPKRFEVTGENPMPMFNKYISDIQDLAFQKNQSIIYKVKVELVKPEMLRKQKKIAFSKKKSKKYNVPLKKQSMKLSNFEVLLRKMAEENGAHGIHNQKKEFEPQVTTDKIIPSNARQAQLKFKPILGGVKTNYAKVIKPVRNKIITLS